MVAFSITCLSLHTQFFFCIGKLLKYNVEIVAASVDIPPMLNSAKAMFERNDWDFTFLHDVNQEFISALGIRGIPFSILVDGEGQVQSVQQGYFPGYEKKLEKKIAAIVQ